MKFTKNFLSLTFQVILSLIFLNTSISFAQNINKWNEGAYLGVSLIFNTVKDGDASYVNTDPSIPGQTYDGDREISKGLKIGYNKMITNNIFVGPEFSYSTEKSLDFNDSSKGGVTDTVRFKGGYNVGLKAGYAVSNDIAYVVGIGRSYQTVETSSIDNDTGMDTNIKKTDLYGFYREFGMLFNLGSGYNLGLLYQINSINSSPIHKDSAPDGARIPYDITINKTKNTSITISKFF